MNDLNNVQLASRTGTITAIRTGASMDRDRGSALTRFQTREVLQSLCRDGDRPALTRLYALAIGTDVYLPSQISDDDILSGIEKAVDTGRLILVGGGIGGGVGAAGGSDGTTAAEVVNQLMQSRDVLSFEGESYRLVEAGAAGAGGDYQIVGRNEMLALLTRMAARIPTTPSESALWVQVVALANAQDGRGGVALLRNTRRPAPPPPPSPPPATPSSLQPKVAVQDWIELQIVYDDDSPFTENCIVTLPDGRDTQGPPDAQGMVRMDNIPSGSCTVKFPTLSQPSS